MVDEIIKLFEYITNNEFFKGVAIVYGIIVLLVIAGVITVFAMALKSINKKRR